nr:hypothetical protein [Tanacetum cinerariifolium]
MSDDHGISNLDNDLVQDNASYHANDEEYKEDRCELLGNPRKNRRFTKLEGFRLSSTLFDQQRSIFLLKNRNHINEAYANTNIDANYNPYLDVSRTFNNHKGRNGEEYIHEEREMSDDHGISNLDNDLVQDNASYHANDEEYKEDRCELLGNPRKNRRFTKLEGFRLSSTLFDQQRSIFLLKNVSMAI